jgi:hypothetical protein
LQAGRVRLSHKHGLEIELAEIVATPAPLAAVAGDPAKFQLKLAISLGPRLSKIRLPLPGYPMTSRCGQALMAAARRWRDRICPRNGRTGRAAVSTPLNLLPSWSVFWLKS